MGRRRKKRGYKIGVFGSGRTDGVEPHFLQIGVTLFEHPTFQSLTPTQRYLYLCMLHDAEGRREFVFPQARFKHFGLKNTAARDGIEALIQKGFIVRLFSGKVTREASGYAFSHAWKLNQNAPTTDE